MRRSIVAVLLLVVAAFGCSSSTTGTPATSPVTSPASVETTPVTVPPLPEPHVYSEACRLLGYRCDDVDGEMPAAMLRPIALPDVSSGEPCPISPIVSTPTGANFGLWAFDSGTAVGLAAAPSPTERVSVANRAPTHSILPWAVKALWYATAAHDGPILIRGKQLDGSGPIAFAAGTGAGWLLIPPGRTPNTSNGIRTVPSAILVAYAGCYGFQIDTPTFTGSVVVQVALAS